MANAVQIGNSYWRSGYTSGFANAGKTRTYAEQGSFEVEVTGQYSDLVARQPKPNSTLTGDISKWGLPSLSEGSWGVKNSSLVGDEGGLAKLRLSLVLLGTDGSYDTTYDVDMREVSKSIKTHPLVLASNGALDEIQQWEATPEAVRKYSDSTGVKYRYYKRSADDIEGTLTAVTNTAALACIKAMESGIENFNVYLPVITRVRHFLTAFSSGTTINYDGTIGKFESPPITLSGYPNTSGKNWFKSADKISKANDGSVTRTEEWTYTNDTTHSWIYANSIS